MGSDTFVCFGHLSAVRRSYSGQGGGHLGQTSVEHGWLCACVGLAGSAIPQVGRGVRLAAFTHMGHRLCLPRRPES